MANDPSCHLSCNIYIYFIIICKWIMICFDWKLFLSYCHSIITEFNRRNAERDRGRQCLALTKFLLCHMYAYIHNWTHSCNVIVLFVSFSLSLLLSSHTSSVCSFVCLFVSSAIVAAAKRHSPNPHNAIVHRRDQAFWHPGGHLRHSMSSSYATMAWLLWTFTIPDSTEQQ